MSNTVIFVILVLICIAQCIQLFRAYRKIERYRERIKSLTNVQNRFHEIFHLHANFGWLTQPFFEYVMNGGRRIEDVRDEIRHSFDEQKQKAVEKYLSTTSLMKIQKDQTSVKRN